jgi:RHS repeat-associated protein
VGRAILSATLLLIFSPTLSAQTVAFQATGDNATGWSPLGTYNYGDFDWIDLANGALNLKIPFASMTSRGHTSHYELDYSSKFWSVYPIQGQTGLYASWRSESGSAGVGPAAGWMHSDITGSGVSLTHVVNPLQCIASGGHFVTVRILSNYVYTDPGGAKHNFPDWKWANGPPSNGIQCEVPTTPYLTGYASDNSGAFLDITTVNERVSFPSGNFSSNGSATLADPNGNTWNQYTAANGQTFVQVTTGSGGRVESVKVLDASGNWQTYPITYGQVTTTAAFPNPWNGGVQGTTINTINQISLPDSQSIQFQYQGAAGELTKVILPTGGYIRFEYTTVPTSMYAAGWATFVPADGRYVTKRAVSPDGTAGSEQVWTYSYSRTDSSNPSSPLTTTVTHPDGTYEIHTFTRSLSDPYRETSVEYHESNGALLRRTSKNWVFDTVPTISEFTETPMYDYGNYRIASTTTALNDGQQSQANIYYDTLSYTDIYGQAVNTTRGNTKKIEETGYGPGAPGTVARVTKFQYLYEQNSAYLTPYIINPVTAKWVGTPTNTFSLSEYVYDTTMPSGLHGNLSISKAALLAPGAPNADSPPDTSVSAWISTTNSFDTHGNLTQSVSPLPKQYTTAFEYNQCNSGFLSATNYAASGIREEQTWNCNIGQVAQKKDANLQLTNYQYSDPLHRVTRIDFPDQGYEIYTYNDSTRNVTAKKNIQLSPLLEYVVGFDFDQLGRLSHRRLTSAPEGTIATDTTFDNLGRIATTSNLYLSPSDPTYGISTNQYDALNRSTKVIPPDGSSGANNVSTVFTGNCAVVADQVGKIRKSCSDALGRVTQVFEPDASNALVNETDYQYDVLNNLARVDQKGNSGDSTKWRTRLFTYSSLSQLTQASNPESGTINYTYDNDGNLQTKTDARAVTTTYTYDGVHRLTGKTYSNGDPAVSYTYDQAGCLSQPTCANVGRRTGMTDAAGSEAWSYDIMGRPLVDQRTTISTPSNVTKTTISTHMTGGFLSQLTYPSTRVVTYTYDAAGRATTGVDTGGGINYATGALYLPSGALRSLTNGANLISTFYYNNRLQPCRISVKSIGTAPGTCTDAVNIGNILDFTYDFSLGTADNGNVLGIANNRDTTRSQAYTYDTLNRLTTAQTTSTFATSPAHCWGESFNYDSWGNFLSIGVASTPYNGCTQENLSILASPKNQIYSPSGYVYDLAGNMTGMPGASYTYNAENQMTATAGITYTYDGDGKRVKKSNGKLYWYGGGGDVLDETDLSGNLTSEFVFFAGKRIAKRDALNNVDYYFADHLGTSRVVTSATGTVLNDSDFYPFGGERPVTGPTSGNNYKFTGKERDTESGLDNFGARYNASTMGRFMTPDPPLMDQHIADPQSWNLYSYVRNNPLSFVDPDGNAIELLCTGSDASKCAGERQKELEFLQNSLGNDKAASNLYINEVKDGDNIRYFVGIKGDVGDFMKQGDTAHDLANLVENKNVVEFGLTSKDLSNQGGAVTYEKGEVGNQNVRVLVNPEEADVANRVLSPNTILGASRWGGQNQDPRWRVNPFTGQVMGWHEFGHAWGYMNGRPLDHTNPEADAWENRMREQLYGPTGPNNAPRVAH